MHECDINRIYCHFLPWYMLNMSSIPFICLLVYLFKILITVIINNELHKENYMNKNRNCSKTNSNYWHWWRRRWWNTSLLTLYVYLASTYEVIPLCCILGTNLIALICDWFIEWSFVRAIVTVKDEVCHLKLVESAWRNR